MACVGPSKGLSLSTLDLNHLIDPSYCYISKTPLSYGWALGGIRVLWYDSGFRVEAKAVLMTPTHGTSKLSVLRHALTVWGGYNLWFVLIGVVAWMRAWLWV